MGGLPRGRAQAASAARRALRTLRVLADPAVARRGRTFFKPNDDVVLFGVTTPVVRRVAADVWREVRDVWTVREALWFADRLTREPALEPKAVGVLVLERFHRDLDAEFLLTARRWVLEHRFPNWAAIDTLAPTLVAPVLRRRPSLVGRVESWARSRDLWLRRAAIVSFVPLARRGLALDCAYRLVERRRGDREDLMHKAMGWLLREAGKTDPARLRRFLELQGGTLPRTTVRYAIERFRPDERARLLAVTRSGYGTATTPRAGP